MDVPRNVPLQLACKVDANPADDLTFHWSLFSPWTSKEIEFNHTELEHFSIVDNRSVSVLDVGRAVTLFVDHSKKDNNKNFDEKQEEAIDHTTLLLQCDAENVAGRQDSPCAFMLRIVDGK